MSYEANTVWNYCNELSHRAIREKGRFFSAYDLDKYLTGSSAEFENVNYSIIQAVAHEYAKSRKQAKKARLSWRKSFGSKRSLGWVPFKHKTATYKQGQIKVAGRRFGIWDSYGLGNFEFRSGCFTEDARGRWYFCAAVEVEAVKGVGVSAIGIDLGLKAIASCSDGTTLDNTKWYRAREADLAAAQRAYKKGRVRAIHAKVANRRRDALHKFSRQLVDRSSHIVVGGVSPSALKKTNMAKSVSDAGWASLKLMLKYKCEHAGITYTEMNEAYTTQTCSSCGALPDSRPKGIAGLGIREWDCDECGAHHDRDVNAARNILALGLGHGPPVVGIAA